MKERLIQIVDRFVTFLDDVFAFVLVYGGISALVYVVWLIGIRDQGQIFTFDIQLFAAKSSGLRMPRVKI